MGCPAAATECRQVTSEHSFPGATPRSASPVGQSLRALRSGSSDLSRRREFAPLLAQFPHPRLLHAPHNPNHLVIRRRALPSRTVRVPVPGPPAPAYAELLRGGRVRPVRCRSRRPGPRPGSVRLELGPKVVQRDDLLHDFEDEGLVDFERREERDRVRGRVWPGGVCGRGLGPGPRTCAAGRGEIDRASTGAARDAGRRRRGGP